MKYAVKASIVGTALAVALLAPTPNAGAQQTPPAQKAPSIKIEVAPPWDPGGESNMARISGSTQNAPPGSRVVIYSRGDIWWVQPYANAPFTDLDVRSGRWQTDIHLGTEYVVLLVKSGYDAKATLPAPPVMKADVLAMDSVIPKKK